MNKNEVTTVQSLLDNQFGFHVFIRKFLRTFSFAHGQMLIKENDSTVHAEISNYLKNHSDKFGIYLNGTRDSIDIFNNKTEFPLRRKTIDAARNKTELLNAKSLILLILILMSLTVSAQPFGSFSILSETESTQETPIDEHVDNLPNSRMLTAHRTVMDTIRAEAMFLEIKPTLLAPLEKGQEKQKRCESLLVSKAKKVKTTEDINLLGEAYHCFVTNHPECKKEPTPIWATMFIPVIGPALTGSINSVRNEQKEKYYDKDVKKGKLTDNVRKYLRYYNGYLHDSLQQVKSNIDVNWLNYLPEIPKKTITERKPNPLYRGFFYNSQDTLDLLEVYQQRKGWEFLYTDYREAKYDTYPAKLNYYVYDSAPNYKVRMDGNKEVYDANGNLIYMPSLTRESSFEFDEIKRIIYLRDYDNNKYDIKTKSQHTQDYLRLLLCRECGFEKSYIESVGIGLATTFARGLYSQNQKRTLREGLSRYLDEDGRNYINQLRNDHANEFKYIYMIERLSDVSFRVVYLNENLKPSICAIVTYETWHPFASTYSARLVEMPDDIPPVVKD